MTEKNEVPARIALFRKKQIRRTLHKNEWWFVIADVVAALTDSADPQGYIKDIRRPDPEIEKGWGQIATPLSIPTSGGAQNLNCANTEGLFRLIQSISSPKAEPFKRWLAKVGSERIQEIENPELASQRSRALYKAKGYSEFKGLKRENLRDPMDDLELILSMLGEASTTEITRHRDSQGFIPSRDAARAGGAVAGNARRELEIKSGRPVVSRENYLSLTQAASKKLVKRSLARLKTTKRSLWRNPEE